MHQNLTIDHQIQNVPQQLQYVQHQRIPDEKQQQQQKNSQIAQQPRKRAQQQQQPHQQPQKQQQQPHRQQRRRQQQPQRQQPHRQQSQKQQPQQQQPQQQSQKQQPQQQRPQQQRPHRQQPQKQQPQQQRPQQQQQPQQQSQKQQPQQQQPQQQRPHRQQRRKLQQQQSSETQQTINQLQTLPSTIDALIKELKELLKRLIDENRGEALLPAGVPGRITKPVPLLITKVRQILDDEWKLHRNQREDLQRMYTPWGSIHIEELFDVAKQVAEEEAINKCNTPAAKAMHVVKYGNIVCAVGLPGVGKSTLLKMMINCIIVDKSVKPDTQFLFHVSLKNFNPDEKVSLLEFLLYGNLSEWNHSDEENKALVHFLYKNPNVVILIDGWDELSTQQANKKFHACKLESRQIPEVFVKNLLMGNLLPNAVKFITSRPGQFYELHPDYRQGLISEVRGMDKPAKKNLTKQICGEANLESVEKVLAERPNLDALCSIPVNCIQIVACLHSSVSSGREINSMTDVFIRTLTNYKASDHVRTNMSERALGQELVKLAHLAYKGLSARKLVFQQADFEEVGINGQTVDIFLHTYVEKTHHLKMRILEGKKRSFFTHLTWQEFFAAGHLMLFMPQKEFRKCMRTFDNPHWVMVTRFLFGMCNSTSYEDLKVIFPASMIKDYKEKKNILKSLFSLQDDETSEEVIRFSGWVHEANDAEISKRFQECMPQYIRMKFPMYLTEASDLTFAFNSFTTSHDLNLNMRGLDEASPETFFRGLHGRQAKIKELDIRGVQVTDSTTEALLPHLDVMDKLDLDERKLSVQSLIILHEAVERHANPQSGFNCSNYLEFDSEWHHWSSVVRVLGCV
uniref:NACHT, LRR and PYD domains-containing protein 5-like isoform X2 n=1 Tax=Ciona intestinalis TaxID=7719 RepID=UPI000EF52E7A|nr:NACHT, LRR and PYD domains-containing protein 5-like isoform X2 [Ciona intestinalis]|eukprot:XP_026693942.1 NACHT, LRR and PYD domains-containing protein 5-like isoform X2 [Ciona intestinalis]